MAKSLILGLLSEHLGKYVEGIDKRDNLKFGVHPHGSGTNKMYHCPARETVTWKSAQLHLRTSKYMEYIEAI